MFKKLTIKEIAAITLCLIRNNESMYQVRGCFEIMLNESKSPKYRFTDEWHQRYFYFRIDRQIKIEMLELLVYDCLTTQPQNTLHENIIFPASQNIQSLCKGGV